MRRAQPELQVGPPPPGLQAPCKRDRHRVPAWRLLVLRIDKVLQRKGSLSTSPAGRIYPQTPSSARWSPWLGRWPRGGAASPRRGRTTVRWR